MAIWVCRTGTFGEYEYNIFECHEIYLTRAGYNLDLKGKSKEEIISLISEHNEGCSRQTISNIWSQIEIFVNRMQPGDIVIIPKKGKYEISVAKITSEYEYKSTAPDVFRHRRSVAFIARGIGTTAFPKDLFYSLGAYRAIFSIKQESRLLAELRKIGLQV